MKSWLRSLTPGPILRSYRRIKQSKEDRRNANRSPEQVFAEIYREGKWGAGGERFCSGSGSSEDSITRPYVAAVSSFLRSFGEKPHVVDLGCGDFGVGRQLLEDCESYTGVDVVPDLVRHHQESVDLPGVRFLCMDIVRDELPPGDVCLIRQVLQHLSNEQIGKVLAKLGRYSAVLVTEHYPSDATKGVPNLDKVHGSGIRLYDRSGVYLDEPPFNVPRGAMQQLLEVRGTESDGLYEPGVIRTFCLRLSPRA
jgi:Methyltransferase domain